MSNVFCEDFSKEPSAVSVMRLFPSSHVASNRLSLHNKRFVRIRLQTKVAIGANNSQEGSKEKSGTSHQPEFRERKDSGAAPPPRPSINAGIFGITTLNSPRLQQR